MSTDLLCHRLLGALLNGGYQGLLLTASVGLGLRLMPRSNAATRHAVWFVTLLVVAALPVFHFVLSRVEAGGVRVADFQTAAKPANIPMTGLGLKDSNQPTSERVEATSAARLTDLSAIPFDGVVVSPAASDLPRPTGVHALDEMPPDDLFAANERATRDASVPAEPAATHSPALAQGWQLTLPNRVGVVLVGLWSVLALVRLGGLFVQLVRLHVLKRRATFAPQIVRALFSKLSADMALRRPTRLLLCDEPIAPMAVGFRRPAVLLPAKLVADATEVQLQQVLRHELAHVARGDDWANLAQQTVKAVLFFHPAVWWLSRRLTLEREIACDDHVLTAMRTPRDYALLLTEFAARMRCRDLTAAPAAWNHRNELTERIAMILDSKRNSSPRLAVVRVGILTTALAAAAGLALFAAPRLALAVETPASAAAPDALEIPEADDVVAADNVPVALATPAVVSADAPPLSLQAPTPFAQPPALMIASADVAESGPRHKSNLQIEAPVALPALPVPPTPSSAVASGFTLSRPVDPAIAVAPAARPVSTHGLLAFNEDANPAAEQPSPAERRGPKVATDTSMERRLQRLERLVAELVGQEKSKRATTPSNMQFKFAPAPEQEKLAKLAAEAGHAGGDEAEMHRITDSARKDAERAQKDVAKTTKEAQRANADPFSAAHANGQPAKAYTEKDALEMQRKELEAQRHRLEKQMEALERQLNRLESAQENIAERAERDRELQEKRMEEKHSDENRSEHPASGKLDGSSDDDDGPKKKTAK